MKNIKNALFMQGMNAFIGGSLEVLLPLLLLERNIRIEHIGLIFALGPIVFQVSRIIFAAISDFFGRKKFFIANSILNPIGILIYYLASSPIIYVAGQIMDSLSGAFFWSVNRAFFLEQDKNKKKNLIHMRTVDNISQALGRFIIGFLIVYIFFYNALLLLALVSISIIPVSLMITDKQKKKLKISNLWKVLNLKNKSKEFKEILVYFTFLGMSNGIIFSGYVIPVFLSSKNFSAGTIGLLLGAQLFLSGLVGYAIRKFKMKHLLLWSALLFTVFTLMLEFTEYYLLAILIAVLLGITSGAIGVNHEFIFSHLPKKECYAIDIALILIGFHLGRSISQAVSGFLIPSVGFFYVFLFSIITFIIYSGGTYRILKDF